MYNEHITSRSKILPITNPYFRPFKQFEFYVENYSNCGMRIGLIQLMLEIRKFAKWKHLIFFHFLWICKHCRQIRVLGQPKNLTMITPIRKNKHFHLFICFFWQRNIYQHNFFSNFKSEKKTRSERVMIWTPDSAIFGLPQQVYAHKNIINMWHVQVYVCVFCFRLLS